MKKYRFVFCLLLFCIPHLTFAQQPLWQWGRDAGGAGNDLGYAISTDVNGSSYVAGRFNATDTFGTHSVTSYGGPDIFLAKYDTYGSCLWVRHGGSYDVNDIYGDEGDGVDIDSDGNAYITGNFYTQASFGALTLTCPTAHRQIFVVKYDSSGNEIWAQQAVGITNNYSRAIAVDAAGNSYITGYLGGGSNTFGAFTITHPGAFVVKYDSSGVVQYATSLATNGGVDAYGIDIDAWGNAYVTGYLQGQDIIAGQTFTSTGDRDAFLIKVDAAGNFEWLKQTQSIAGTHAYGRGVAVDVQGNPIITGDFDDFIIIGPYTLSGMGGFGTEAFVIKYDSAGNPLWAKQSLAATAFASNTQAFAITSDLNSNACITGVYRDTVNFGTQGLPDFGTQTFVVMYDSSGNSNWAIGSRGGNVGAFGYGISTDHNGSYFIAGFDKYGPVFGNDVLTAHGGEDIFVAKLGLAIAQANYAAADSTICPGTCSSFTNLSVNATSYQWSFPGAVPASSTDENPSNICYNTPGSYDVQLIATNANGSDTLLITNYITVYPSPAAQAISQNGDTLFANAGAVSYQWYYNGNILPGATDHFYIASASGDYNVVATDENGCEVEAAIFNVLANVQFEARGLEFEVYPNPVAGELKIKNEIPMAIGIRMEAVEISIYTVIGEKINAAVDLGLLTADCRLLPPGIYCIEVLSGEKIFRSTFVKQ